jgi:hypothetical protein
MAKTPTEITAKVREIYDLAHDSDTPLSVLSLQSTILLGQTDWLPEDVERVSGAVVELLIRHGWKRQP